MSLSTTRLAARRRPSKVVASFLRIDVHRMNRAEGTCSCSCGMSGSTRSASPRARSARSASGTLPWAPPLLA